MGKLLDNLRKKHAGDQAAAKRHGLNFLAHRDEIVEALKEGWTAKQVWEQMVEDGMTTMSYASFCRHVKMNITLRMDDANDAASLTTEVAPPFGVSKKSPSVSTTKKSKAPAGMTEKERLDLLKEEAFASVKSRKPSGPLIEKPKSRADENRELFGN